MKNMFKDYFDEFNMYFKKFIKKFKIIKKAITIHFQSVKNSLLDYNNRKRNLIVIGSSILLNLVMLTSFFSFAYYHNDDFLVLTHTKVGNYNYDYLLLVYLESPSDGTYFLTDEIPKDGYTYSGYKCQNNSSLVYDGNNYTASIEFEKQDLCSIYFNRNNTPDVTLNVMVEDSFGSGNYEISTTIPSRGFLYDHHSCQNGSFIEYNEETNKIIYKSIAKDSCDVYFNVEEDND